MYTEEWLRANGYDGLANDECGCNLNDGGIRPCGYVPVDEDEDCLPAHETSCTSCGKDCDPGYGVSQSWCMRPGKREDAR